MRDALEKLGRIVDLTDHSPDPRVQEAHDLANELWAALSTEPREPHAMTAYNPGHSQNEEGHSPGHTEPREPMRDLDVEATLAREYDALNGEGAWDRLPLPLAIAATRTLCHLTGAVGTQRMGEPREPSLNHPPAVESKCESDSTPREPGGEERPKCMKCGKRSTTPGDWAECFTVCDECWPLLHPKADPERPVSQDRCTFSFGRPPIRCVLDAGHEPAGEHEFWLTRSERPVSSGERERTFGPGEVLSLAERVVELVVDEVAARPDAGRSHQVADRALPRPP